MNNKRINFIFIIFTLVFISENIYSQASNNWISYISYSENIDVIAQSDDDIFALTDGKLFIYNQSDESITEFIKYKGGNTDITNIAYNKTNKCLVITRSNADIDLLYDNGAYSSIPDIKNHIAQNLDKTINHIFTDGNLVYLSTNYGFSIVDISKKVIAESGIFNKKFYSLCILNNKLYATTEEGVYSVEMGSDSNIIDWARWQKVALSNYYLDTDYKFDDTDIKKVVAFKDKLYFLFPDSAIYVMETPESVTSILKGAKPTEMYKSNNDHLIVLNKNKFWDFSDQTVSNSSSINNLTYIIPNGNKLKEYWVAVSGYNLSLANIEDTEVTYEKQWIAPQGPTTNYPFSQTMQNGQLIVTGGGYYDAAFGIPASLSILKNNQWSNIYPGNIAAESGIYTEDFGYAISDPSNPNRIFASSWGQGLYEFDKTKFVKRYDHTNSSLQQIEVGDYRTTRVGGMAYDKNGTLWMLNSMVKNTIVGYKKNGEWVDLYYSEIDGTKENTDTKALFIDRYSNKWVGTLQRNNYLFVSNSDGSISKSIHKGDFLDQYGNQLDINDINDISEDINGNIWLSTDVGPYWISNSSNVASKSDLRLNKVRINKGTGSGSVTGLLEGTYINAIRIDGANRKWIATQSSGVFLLSSDNKETLDEYNFNLDNSPLPSNNIISLAIDQQSGTVYFGSDRGLMAYKTSITEGSENLSDVYVYPNPVRPDYSGVITITGLELDTNIKITDLTGNLIVEGKSLGGQFVWDGLTSKGKKAGTGVYIVFASSQNGSEKAITKIMIVR